MWTATVVITQATETAIILSRIGFFRLQALGFGKLAVSYWQSAISKRLSWPPARALGIMSPAL
jgi:hypothetical protein